jgi:hypothetical protein
VLLLTGTGVATFCAGPFDAEAFDTEALEPFNFGGGTGAGV